MRPVHLLISEIDFSSSPIEASFSPEFSRSSVWDAGLSTHPLHFRGGLNFVLEVENLHCFSEGISILLRGDKQHGTLCNHRELLNDHSTGMRVQLRKVATVNTFRNFQSIGLFQCTHICVRPQNSAVHCTLLGEPIKSEVCIVPMLIYRKVGKDRKGNCLPKDFRDD